MHRQTLLCVLALGVNLFLSSAIQIASAEDWPQWRGANRDGVWKETGLIEKFSAEQIPIRWSAKISSGYSGPTVAQGRVYVTDRLVEPAQQERVHCFDEQTGKPLWSHTYDCVYSGVGYEAGPRASVTIDDGRAYSLGTMGHLFCFDAASGQILWQHDCDKEYAIEMPIWGIAASPIIDGDLVIVQIGGQGACLVAFDRKTGKERWKALDDRASYSSPIFIEQAGRKVLVCWTGDNVVGLDPQSGTVHWKYPFKPTRMVINIATPVVSHDRMFVTSFYDGAAMLDVDPAKLAVKEIWRKLGPDEIHTEALHSIISTPVFQGDYVYGVDSYGELRCLDAKTGDRIWENLTATPKVRWGTIHFVQNGDKVWMFNERGELIIGRLSPEKRIVDGKPTDGFEEISRAKLLEPTLEQLNRRGVGVCWAHPAFANRHVFARSDDQLVSASLAAE